MRILTPQEIDAMVSSSNPLQNLVNTFNQEVIDGGYSQSQNLNYSIPVWGTALNNSVGQVIIFPDPSGTLQFMVAEDQNDIGLWQAVFYGQAGSAATANIVAMLNGLLGVMPAGGFNLTQAAAWLFGGYIALNFIRRLTRRLG